MKKQNKKNLLIAFLIILGCALSVCYYYFFSSVSKETTTQYICIDNDDTQDSVISQLGQYSNTHSIQAISFLFHTFDYSQHIKTGRYELNTSIGALRLFRNLRNGMQAPVRLTIPNVRTIDKLAAEISKKLMMDSAQLHILLTDQQVCRSLGYDTASIISMFIPNTYDVYWNITPEKFLKRIKKENNTFWNESRNAKARAIGLTPMQVYTLASIVDEETANKAEKPMVAGMYINRLKLRDAKYPNGMPLQADPTIKFAWKQFELKRIYNKLLYINSPYNTYKNPGLPPGPIRIASVDGIDAVLNAVHHPYLYMCAKEDFSGTHNFARTYSEHLANAAKYSKALNERGIK